MDRQQFTRRLFLQQSSCVGTAAVLATGSLRAQASGKRLRLAFIGLGNRGLANLETMIKDPDVEVVAICDVNSQKLDTVQKRIPDARTYKDFRKLYERTDDIDGVVVSTPEHTHAFTTLPALRLGKHVYCEKPLTHNIAEARLITEAAKKSGVATQMGTQRHASSNSHRVVELIQSGSIGQVSEAHVWVSRAWGLQSKADSKTNKDIVYVAERPTEAMPVPDYLDWELWLGPAPYRRYHEIYFPGPGWYRWWDFGNGTMSDLGSHWNDLPYWALKLDAPLSVEARGDSPHPEIAPASMTATYEYGARGDLPPCKLSWYQGTHKPQLYLDGKIPNFPNGVLFLGDKGMLLADYTQYVLLPETTFQGFEPPKPFIPDSPGQHEEWLQACKFGSPTSSPFSYAGPLTEANHLGNVAFRAGGKILWDAKAMRVTNNDAANQFLSRKPRAGWSLE